MFLFYEKFGQFLNKRRFLFLNLPIIVFPIFCLLELAVVFHLIENYFTQLLIGSYFILIIPLYPLIVFPSLNQKLDDFYLANKLPILGASNLSLFIFYAIINRTLTNQFHWIDLFIFSVSVFVISFLLTITMHIRRDPEINRGNKPNLIRLIKSNYNRIKIDFQRIKLIPKNYFLFLIFLVVLGIFTVQRFPGLFGDDPWLHSAITEQILNQNNYNSVDEHYNSLIGLYSLGAYFSLLSDLDVIQVARFFPVMTFILGGLLGYSLTNFIIKNPQLSIIGGVIFIITPLDNGLTLGQYWPTAIASIMGITCFLVSLNISFNGWNDQISKCFLFVLGFILFYIHDFTAILFFIGFIFVYIVQKFRNKDTNIISLLIIISSLLISLIFRLISGIGLFSKAISQIFVFPPVLWMFIVPGAIVVLYFSAKLIKKPKGNNLLREFLYGFTLKKGKRAKLFTLKLQIIVLILGFCISMLISLIFPNIFKYSQTKPFGIGMDIFFAVIMIFLSLSGAISLHRMNFKSDFYFYLILYFFLAIGGFFLIDIILIHHAWWFRIVINSSGIISVGLCSYLYIYYEMEIKTRRKKYISTLVLLIALVFNFCTYQTANYWYKTDFDINSGENISANIPSGENLVITGFRWSYMLEFFTEFQIETKWESSYLLKVENLTSTSGSNMILRMSDDSDNLYILLDHQQSTLGIMGLENVIYGILNETDLESYYTNEKNNKISSSMTSNGVKFCYLFWVIG